MPFSFDDSYDGENGTDQAPNGPDNKVAIASGHGEAQNSADSEQDNKSYIAALTALSGSDGNNAAREKHYGDHHSSGASGLTVGFDGVTQPGGAGLEQDKNTEDNGQDARYKFPGFQFCFLLN